jgi:hypothetical protein
VCPDEGVSIPQCRVIARNISCPSDWIEHTHCVDYYHKDEETGSRMVSRIFQTDCDALVYGCLLTMNKELSFRHLASLPYQYGFDRG